MAELFIGTDDFVNPFPVSVIMAVVFVVPLPVVSGRGRTATAIACSSQLCGSSFAGTVIANTKRSMLPGPFSGRTRRCDGEHGHQYRRSLRHQCCEWYIMRCWNTVSGSYCREDDKGSCGKR